MRRLSFYIRKHLFLLAALAGGLWLLLVGCSTPQPAKPGEMSWSREHLAETGEVVYRETLVVAQNENPSSPTTIRIPEMGSVDFGRSFLPAAPIHPLPKSLLTGAGIIALLAAAGLGAIGKHWKLMTISLLLALVFFAVAATLDRYPWIYGAGVGVGALTLAVVIGWWLWARYKAQLAREGDASPIPPARGVLAGVSL